MFSMSYNCGNLGQGELCVPCRLNVLVPIIYFYLVEICRASFLINIVGNANTTEDD